MGEELIEENKSLRQIIESQNALILKLESIKDKFILIFNECNCDSINKINQNLKISAKEDVNRSIEEYNELKTKQSLKLLMNELWDKKCKKPNNESKIDRSKPQVDSIAINSDSVNKKLDLSDDKTRAKTSGKSRVSIADRFPCSWPGCESKFSAKYLLKAHLLSHTGEKPYACDWPGCEKRYNSMGNLNHHKDYHTDNRRYKCLWPGCEEKFIRKEWLDKHTCEAHTGKQRYICDWPGCEFQTAYTHNLKHHKRTHTNEKPHKCDWPNCEWSFIKLNKLKEHMLTHTGERPYPCESSGCGQRFKSRRAMKYHFERNHKN